MFYGKVIDALETRIMELEKTAREADDVLFRKRYSLVSLYSDKVSIRQDLDEEIAKREKLQALVNELIDHVYKED